MGKDARKFLGKTSMITKLKHFILNDKILERIENVLGGHFPQLSFSEKQDIASDILQIFHDAKHQFEEVFEEEMKVREENIIRKMKDEK